MSGEVDERLPRPCAPSWCASRRTRRRPRKLFGRLGPPDAGAVLAQHGDLEYLAGDGASDGMSNSSASGLGERRRAVLPGEVVGARVLGPHEHIVQNGHGSLEHLFRRRRSFCVRTAKGAGAT